jgi:aspartate dehydrogenase
LPGWEVCSVLVRRAGADRGPLFTTSPGDFLGTAPDLVVEVAGPAALAATGERLLHHADLWTTSAAALADQALLRRLEATGRSSGHRLRILPGAFAGLDGVAAGAIAPGTTLQLEIDLPPGPESAGLRFSGPVREAAQRFPNALNVAVAAALAGPGLDATHIEVRHPGAVARHRLVLHADSAAGTLHVEVQPELGQGVHPVACSVIAALRRELQVVWAG